MRRLLVITYAEIVLATLAIRPLWVDELNQLVGSRGSMAALLQWSLTGPGGAPLAYLLQQWLLLLLPLTTFTARLPAALFGIASISVFYRLAQRWSLRRPALATILFGLLPMVLRYSQEARPYSQALFFALLMLYAWPLQPVLLGIATLLALYTQPFAVFPAIAIFAIALYRREWPSAGAIALAVIAFLPWLWLAHTTAAQAHTMEQFFFSWKQVSPQMLLRELTGGTYWTTLPLLILAILGFRRANSELRLIGSLWLLFSFAGPIAADAAAGYFFASRQLIFVLPILALFAAEAHERRGIVPCLTAMLLIASIVRDVRYPFSAKEDWAAAAKALNDQVNSPDTCIAVAPPRSLDYYAIFQPGLRQHQCASPAASPRVIAVETPYTTPAQKQEMEQSLGTSYQAEQTNTIGGMNIRTLRRRL